MMENNNMKIRKYSDYFLIEEKYFPCIDEAAIKEGAGWKNTFPHTTFIRMLKEMERALAGQNDGKSISIEGAYGTGKSQCAYALRQILQVPEEELRSYWDQFPDLIQHKDLFQKITGHKEQGIVVAHRYASGEIKSAKELYFAIQESVHQALKEQGIAYHGLPTLKTGIIEWLEDDDHRALFDSALKNKSKPWSQLFSQSDGKDVVEDLRSLDDVSELMENIFKLAVGEGVNALSLSAESLLAWLTDVIDQNEIKIVFIWDEFSDYFLQNKDSLSSLQSIVSLVQHKPFYFIPVTHLSVSTLTGSAGKATETKVKNRFVEIEIELPDDIAFNLIGHAFTPKDESWNMFADQFYHDVTAARTKVEKVINVTNPQVMKDILPLHPMAALVLKNIVQTFRSNQRSMFDFIKSSSSEESKSFQWFISEYGPESEWPMLTVDMLWDFCYGRGVDNLSARASSILNVFYNQKSLTKDESTVLKTVLLMQAISEETASSLEQSEGGTLNLLRATDQNLGYVFEGIREWQGAKAGNIAKQLANKGILSKTTENDKSYYKASVLSGDESKITEYKKDILKNTNMTTLIQNGELSKNLFSDVPNALKVRLSDQKDGFQLDVVSSSDLKKTLEKLRNKESVWKFHCLIAVAKTTEDVTTFRSTLKKAAAEEENKNIIFLDALDTPFGESAFDKYVEYEAKARYNEGSNGEECRRLNKKALDICGPEWIKRISEGRFFLYTYEDSDGQSLGNQEAVIEALKKIVIKKFPHLFDFEKGITETQFKTSNLRQSAKSGILQKSESVMKGVEKSILPQVWKVEDYWDSHGTLPISIIKKALDKKIQESFTKSGQISMEELYDTLESDYGFAPTNLTAFFLGFLLKEYACDPYRYADHIGGHDQMTPEKLSDMIANHMSHKGDATFIVRMTPEEKAFYDLTSTVWGFQNNICSSVSGAASEVQQKMKALVFPSWCLEEVDTEGVYKHVQSYLGLVQKEGQDVQHIAIDLGKEAQKDDHLSEQLKKLLTKEQCRKGMQAFLEKFENGALWAVTEDISATDKILQEIESIFSVKHSSLWDKETGEDEIQKLYVDYCIVKESNKILGSFAHSITGCYEEWKEKLKNVRISSDMLSSMEPKLEKIFDTLVKICNSPNDILQPQKILFLDALKTVGSDLKDILGGEQSIFAKAYQPYLGDLSEEEITIIQQTLPLWMFTSLKTECNARVKETVEIFSKNRLNTQLFDLWKTKTGTKNPRDWSEIYKTPILSLLTDSEFEQGKKVFELFHRKDGKENEVKEAIQYLENSTLCDRLSSEETREEAFRRDIVGRYEPLLQDNEKVRDQLAQMALEIYDWRGNPEVSKKVKDMADAEYNAGGSDKILDKIKNMDEAQLKSYLTKLISSNISVGMELLKEGE